MNSTNPKRSDTTFSSAEGTIGWRTNMKKSFRCFAIELIIALCLVGSSLFGLAQGAASSAKSIPPEEINPRLETVLQELARKAEVGPAAIAEFASGTGIPLTDETVRVVIEPVSGRVSAVDQAAVEALGGVVEARSKSLMRVRVPVDRLEAIADRVEGIAFIRLPYQPRPLVTSQGVSLTGATDFHTAGFYGQNTKVAIIDLGFSGLTAAQNAGELDNVIYTHDYTGTGLQTETEHGTGVAEIVADMASQASLYLMKIGDEVDLQNATDYCINNGIDIINHSVGWYNTNYYDGTGVVAGTANNARDQGVLWVNAAGNDADGVNGYTGHWQGAFADGDGDNWHEFALGDERNSFYLASGDTITILMTWDDWVYSDQNYDLYLYNPVGAQVRSSLNWQTGMQHPTEWIEYTATSNGRHSFAIYRESAPASPEIEVFLWNETGPALGLEYNVYESSIVTPANSAKVLAVGAIYRGNWTTGPQETFSSQGPSNASKYAASRTKPDIMGPDGVSSYTYAPYDFYGTSASSPHVAGAAALLLSEDPTRTADQLQAKLEGDAIDMGVAGKDNIYGSGRLNLQLASSGTAAVFRVDKMGNVYADGSFYGAGFHTGSADVAEWVPVSEPVEPGDVLEFDPERAGYYRKTRSPCSTLVGGVVSTNPGFVLGSQVRGSDTGLTTDDSRLVTDDSALLALLGIVPVKVTDEGGPIQSGDLLVASFTPGYAMRWDPDTDRTCGLVGKALEPLESGTGMIQMLLMR